MSELFLRPAHMTIVSSRPYCPPQQGPEAGGPSSRLVLDAPVAASQPVFVESANASGTPVLIDPLTLFFFRAMLR